VDALFLRCGGRKLPGRKRIPSRLSDKINFVRECAEQIASLAQFKNELKTLAADFDSVLETRHNLVHGAITGEVVNGIFTFVRLKAHPDKHTGTLSHYDLHEFPVLEATLMKLGADAPKVARRVADAFPSKTGEGRLAPHHANPS
jgi:hypothetical protein